MGSITCAWYGEVIAPMQFQFEILPRIRHGTQELRDGAGQGSIATSFHKNYLSNFPSPLPRHMPRNARRRTATQIRHTENLRERRQANPEAAEEIAEEYRCTTIEEHKKNLIKAEREAEKSHKDLRNAERRVR